MPTHTLAHRWIAEWTPDAGGYVIAADGSIVILPTGTFPIDVAHAIAEDHNARLPRNPDAPPAELPLVLIGQGDTARAIFECPGCHDKTQILVKLPVEAWSVKQLVAAVLLTAGAVTGWALLGARAWQTFIP